jgi:hypothetical protein
MAYEDLAPAVDKWLHADGSVTTLAGVVILPADSERAEEYASRAAHADKWLREDGSVVDSAGKTLLEADEFRAAEYLRRSPGVGGVLIGGGFDIKESGRAWFPPFINESETMVFAAAIGEGVAFQLFRGAAGGEVIPSNISMSDTAAVSLG